MNPPTKPATNSTASIEDLPWEMISELFEYLPPKDLAACSMVNRRWHSVYAAFKLPSLVATDYDPLFDGKWYDSNQPIREAERCRLAIFCRLAEKPQLSNLKYLALSSCYEFEFDPNDLNRFSQLVHLEINIRFGKRNVHLNLNLHKLRVLAFDHWNHYCSLSIDCPELSNLLYPGVSNLLEVKHPETIKRLNTDLLGPQLAQFKSVESLVTEKFEVISKATLLSLPGLRELHYNENIESLFEYDFGNEVGSVDRVKRTLSEFVDETKKLKGCDFLFTFSGFQLTNVKLDQIDFGVQVDESSGRERVCNEYVYLKNYQLIEPGALPCVDRVDYSLLLSHVTGEFPRCFSQKFTGIQSVRATAEVQDTDHFLWFLKSLKFLRRLQLAKTAFSQEFYNQLPASAHSLTSLELGVDCENELQLNFDFISKLSRLLYLRIYPSLSVESLPSLVRSFGRLEEVHFLVRSREEHLQIWKKRSSTEWKIQDSGDEELLFMTENPDEIVNFIEGLRDGMPESPASD